MKLLALFTLSILLQSCGPQLGTGSNAENEKYYANGVKLISSDIDDPRSPKTIEQGQYTINSSNRLLIRLESLQYRSSTSVITEEKRMYLVISSASFKDNRATYEDRLEVCPLTRNWMMLATWRRASPFPGKETVWNNAGGDFATQDCIKADSSYPEPNPESFYFDISDWYIYYVKSRNNNYGLILKSSFEVTIYGDTNSLYGPYFTWSN